MDLMPLGNTGLIVSRLGFGTGQLGTVDEATAMTLLDTALELGITLFDTAPSYGRAERFLGQWRRARGRGVVLSTKVGYGVPGVPDWTGASVEQGITRALKVLGVERLDIVHLHSCPGPVALRDDIQQALAAALARGQVGVAAYSGENEDLDLAIRSGGFGAVQLSVNVVDQGSRELRLSHLERLGVGVLAKRPLANGAWRDGPPSGPPEQEYQRRFAALGFAVPGERWEEVAIRFAAFTPGVASALVGTSKVDRLRALAGAVARGALPRELEAALVTRWRERAHGFRGVV